MSGKPGFATRFPSAQRGLHVHCARREVEADERDESFWNGVVNHRVKTRVAELLEHLPASAGRGPMCGEQTGRESSQISVKAIRGNYGSHPQKASWICHFASSQNASGGQLPLADGWAMFKFRA